MINLAHCYRRLRELGLRKSAITVHNKLARTLFHHRWRARAIDRSANHTWQGINRKYRLNISFQDYWQTSRNKSLPIVPDQPHNKIIAAADSYTQNQFEILGSGKQIFSQMPWHEDFRLKTQNSAADNTFDARSFYADIRIPTSNSFTIIKDIKVPWELSRCQHFQVLGKAYGATQSTQYADKFIRDITDWLDHNPYLLGINWLCPMEVGIRAINWIWAWQYFRDCNTISLALWERFACSLYDHLHYLENNWEIFDTKTSNHYLSDLLGYLYCCWFFKDLPGIDRKRDWCIKELLREFEKQVFDEGTDYESTTAYHCLVTEIFDHVALVCAAMNIPLPEEFHIQLNRMHEFIEWCTINDNDMVKIGDDDSGRIAPLTRKAIITTRPAGIRHFPHFGLSILKTNTWHITLRHHAYSKKQPSAHFHNDALSITLAVDGIPAIIDPGSYLYTASSGWRNHFRSVKVHNTLYIEGHEPVPFDERLFALNLPENASNGTFSASHKLYARFNLALHRSLDWREEEIIITDTWTNPTEDLTLGWNFTLHPAIEINFENNQWILSHNNKPLIAMKSSLAFQPHDTWIAPEYGIKQKSLCLKASYSGRLGHEAKIVFIKV